MKNYKISSKNLPLQFKPLTVFFTVTCLHYWNAPTWLYWVLLVLQGLHFIFWIWSEKLEDQIDIFENWKDKPQPKEPSKFQQRLRLMAEENGYNYPDK